jgi:hypothetical protein
MLFIRAAALFSIGEIVLALSPLLSTDASLVLIIHHSLGVNGKEEKG